MGVAAPRKQSREAVVPQQVSDTLPALSQRQTQPSETSYTLSSLAETAITLKATPFLPTKLLGRLETPTSFSAPAFAATSSSSHSSAVALGIVFGVFFGTIIFSFIIWHFCRRASTPKSSASTWPSSAKAAINTMPVRHSSAMRYPQRPTPVRVRSGDRKERAVPVQEAEKVHKAAKVVKVIQSDDPPPNSRRDSHPVSQGTGQTRHRRDTSAPRLHPGRQAVVDVSSPTTDKWDDHDFHPHERSRHNHEPDDKAASRRRSHQDDSRNPPPVVYVAGRTSHERRSRRSHERESQDAHERRQTSQTRRRTRRSQPGSVSVVHDSVSAVQASSISAPAVPTLTRRYQPPRYDSASSLTSSSGQSDNLGEESPYLTSSSASSASSSSSSGVGGGSSSRSHSRRRSRSQSPARVRFTIPSGVEQYLDAD